MLHRKQVEAGARGVDVWPAVRWLSECGRLSGKPIVLFEFTCPYDECTLALKVTCLCAYAVSMLVCAQGADLVHFCA